VLPVICIALALHLGHATGVRVMIRARLGLQQWLVAPWAEFQHSMVYYVTDQCRKRLEACINAERNHSEHLLWHCLPDIPVVTHHNRFFSEPPTTTRNWLFSEPPTSERTQLTFSQMKKFCNNSQVSVVRWHFQVGWASVFLWNDVNNQKYVYTVWRFVVLNSTVENDFWISQGTVATSDRRGGQSVTFS